MGIFGGAAAAGGGLGVALGGVLAETFGWRSVFFAYGAVGLLLVPPLLTIQRSAARRKTGREREPMLPALRSLVTDGRLLRIWAAGTAMIAAGIGYATWIPSFFVRDRGLDVIAGGLRVRRVDLGRWHARKRARRSLRRRAAASSQGRRARRLDRRGRVLAVPLVMMTLAPIDSRLQMLGARARADCDLRVLSLVADDGGRDRTGEPSRHRVRVADPFSRRDRSGRRTLLVGLASDREREACSSGSSLPLVGLVVAALLAVAHAGRYIRRWTRTPQTGRE